MTLEEVENASSLALNIDKLELPNQLVAVLADPLLQKLLILRPSDEAYQRVANWLDAILQDVVAGNTDGDTLWDIMDVVKDFVAQTKVCKGFSSKRSHIADSTARCYRQSCSTFLFASSSFGMGLAAPSPSSIFCRSRRFVISKVSRATTS